MHTPHLLQFERFVAYANAHGILKGRPYFSLDGIQSISGEEWGRMRAKFKLAHGITNVWGTPAVRGSERLKLIGSAALHSNQKPLSLTERVILAASDTGDVVWEPFGGLATAALASILNDRISHTAEITESVYRSAVERLRFESDRLF